MDDILDLLDKADETSTKPYKEKKKNLWEEVIEPKDLEVDEMERNIKEYTVVTNGEIEKETLEVLAKVIKVLNAKEYILRSSCDKNDLGLKYANKLAEKKEYYIPWKNFNKGCVDFKTDKFYVPNETVYGIACKIKKNFNDQPAVIRSILARNAALMFGNDGKRPVDFLLIYTKDGKEVAGKDAYKTMGNVASFLYLAKLGNIPVFNINNDTFLERFTEYLKSKS